MNDGEAARAGTFDILGEVVEEYDPRSRHADRFHHVIIGRGIRFPKPDRRRQKDFAEMAEHPGIGFREMFGMGWAGLVLEKA